MIRRRVGFQGRCGGRAPTEAPGPRWDDLNLVDSRVYVGVADANVKWRVGA
jgi:hypothetical protein